MSKLPESWTEIALADVGTWRGGGTPSKAKPEFWTNGTIPWVSPKDMKVSKLDTAQDLITEAAVKGSATNLIAEGSVMLVTRSGILSHSLPVAVNTIQVALNQDIKAVTPHAITDPSFLRLTFECYEREILNSCRKGGTTVHSIEFPALQAFTIPLPPLAEQKRIVAKIEELFSELAAGEESLRRARRQLGVYRQSLLKQAFEGKLTTPWRAQHPDLLESPDQLLARIQAERQQRYQQQLKEWEKAGGGRGRPKKPDSETPTVLSAGSDRANLPNGWCWAALEHVISSGPSNGYSPTSVSFETSTKAITLTATTSGRFDGSHFKYIDEVIPDSSDLWLRDGDILIQRGNTIEYVGVPALYRGIPNQFIYPDLMMKIQVTESVLPEFLTLAINDKRARNYMRNLAVGAAGSMPKINHATLRSLPIPLCSLPEQQEIVRLLDEQFEVIEQNEREIDAALKRSEALRQSILKKAFTGQLVAQDPADEPASALLERIHTEREAQSTKKTKKKAARKLPIQP